MTTPSAFSSDADSYDSSVFGGGGQQRVFIQRFKNPETRIRLCQEPNNHPNQMKTIREHYSTRYRESFACPNHRDNGVPCVGCSDPDSKTRKRNRRFVTNAINDRGELILLKMGPDLHKKFVNKRQRLGTVLNCDWIVVKTGSGLNTDYEPWPGEEYPVPMPTQLINIDQVLAENYNNVAAMYLSSTPLAPVDGNYGPTPFVSENGFGGTAPQGYGAPAGYGQPAAANGNGYGGGAPQGGRITPAYAAPAAQSAPQPPQGVWPPPVGQPPTPPPTGQPVADPWQQPGAPMAPADPWTTPPAPDDAFTPMVPGPQITPQYGQPAPGADPWSQTPPSGPAPQGAGSLFNPPAIDPGPAPWEQPVEQPQAPAAQQPQQAAAAVAVAEPAAAPTPEPEAGFPAPDNGASPKPKDMTIKELRAWLSDPERGVEFPAQAARSRLVKLAEEWQAANPE